MIDEQCQKPKWENSNEQEKVFYIHKQRIIRLRLLFFFEYRVKQAQNVTIDNNVIT